MRIKTRVTACNPVILWLGVILTLLATRAWSQATLVEDGSKLVVAAAMANESLSVNNTALAIDDRDNVAVAFNRIGGANQQTMRAIDSENQLVDYLAIPISGSLVDAPVVGSHAGGYFSFGYFGTDQDQTIPMSDVVKLDSPPPARKSSRSKSSHDWVQSTRRQLFLSIGEATRPEECIPAKVDFEPGLDHPGGAGAFDVLLPALPRSHFLIHCFDGRNFYARLNHDDDPASLILLELSDLGSGQKTTHTPNSALPIVSTTTHHSGPVAIYAGVPETGSGEPLVTLLELAENGESVEIGNILQLEDFPITTSLGPVLSSCGHDLGDSHYWVAFIDNQSQAILARIENSEPSYQILGQGAQSIDVACDTWGNAVVSWWQASSGHSIQTLAVTGNGQNIGQQSETIGGNPFSVTVNAALNAGGGVAVAWAIDNQEIFMRRYRLTGHMQIDGTLSGSHYSQDFGGEGFAFDITELGGISTLVLYYFTYQADGSGEMAWMVGSAPIVANRVIVEVGTGVGATFGTTFDPGDVTITPVGNVVVTFRSCHRVLVETDATGFGELSYLAGRLTDRPLAVDGQCGNGAGGTTSVDGSLGGSIFSQTRSGEGFYFDIVLSGGSPTLVIYYFTYLPDGSGKPAWLVGSGPIVGNQAEVAVGFGSGATFGPGFDPTDVVITPWGSITVTWVSCTEMLIEYDGLWGVGSHSVEPLTPALVGATGLCAS